VAKMMRCSKIGSKCPYPVGKEDTLVFVMMPFKSFDNVYNAIQLAVNDIQDNDFKCLRADEKYTNVSIWCKNICKNIRRAKYLVVDTTGKNANVFYELGFSHALENTKTILITQNIKETPFDIADLNHIVYSPENLGELRTKLKDAIYVLEKEETNYDDKTHEEMLHELFSLQEDAILHRKRIREIKGKIKYKKRQIKLTDKNFWDFHLK
jgi:hypothetical protein